MKNKFLVILIFLFIIIGIFIYIYPHLEFCTDNYLYLMSYGKVWEQSEDFEELDQETCYDESYSYNKKRNISIKSWEYKKFLIFNWFKINYKKGNVCASEYLLEESYIDNFLDNAEIISNEDQINLVKLIENKKAIVANKRYFYDDSRSYIEYILDGNYMEMFIFTNEDGLLVIQVGLSDEGPKYIAYR